ncbi:Hypothetical protein R9X50_00078600 [Acrodontium crateriforme]|uniref:Myb-like domain-containing protein n=1 Tax=Acrodontium crateriforme TaxID=150365 RepID=A0AAQ3R579_9PEZI|nr:Hypothetical protein R9X50_00078600 [Acrodontium crateriforme]
MHALEILPIMPKENKIYATHRQSAASDPYPITHPSVQRNAAIWGSEDDEVLLQARASGLNWQPIAEKYFPSKSANACRKRHERLIERRHVEDWDSRKLELLAQEYLACRKEMWEMLAARVGERWAVVEAKCMEKGLKNLQSTVRMAQRKSSVGHYRSHSDHASDSGIGLGSDNEMDEPEMIDDNAHKKSVSWHAPNEHHHIREADHVRSRSLPQLIPLLPLYQPPPPLTSTRRVCGTAEMTTSPENMTFGNSRLGAARCSPESTGRISIESVLSPEDPQQD